MPIPEADWLTKARELDEKALEVIYDAFSDELYRYAYRLLGNQQAAEDLVAEAYYRLIRALHAGGGPRKHLRAYLYRVAHNLAVDDYRRGEGADWRREDEAEDLQADDDPALEAEKSIEGAEARAALWQITSEQRQVIILKYFQGMSNKEVAAVLQKPIGAVKSLQHRGLKALHRILKIDGADMEDGT